MGKFTDALIASMEEENEKLEKEMAEQPELKLSRTMRRNTNAFFREDLKIDHAHHPEVDNAWERFRTRMYLKYPQHPWISRLYKTRKRRAKRNAIVEDDEN
jgi:hypothetical protein